jgi:O-antigen/teichoic acid export membrane protein
MKINEYHNKSTQELKKITTVLKIISGFLGFALLLLLTLNIYSAIFQKTSTRSWAVLPISLSPILLVNLYNLKQLDREIKKRKN